MNPTPETTTITVTLPKGPFAEGLEKLALAILADSPAETIAALTDLALHQVREQAALLRGKGDADRAAELEAGIARTEKTYGPVLAMVAKAPAA